MADETRGQSSPGETSPELLRYAARRAEERPGFLAWVFAGYRGEEGLDDAGLARVLDMPIEQISAMALCLRPRADRFAEDVRAIAERFGANPARLATLIRQVEATQALREAVEATGWRQVAAAARDAEEPAADEDEEQ